MAISAEHISKSTSLTGNDDVSICVENTPVGRKKGKRKNILPCAQFVISSKTKANDNQENV